MKLNIFKTGSAAALLIGQSQPLFRLAAASPLSLLPVLLTSLLKAKLKSRQ